MDRSEEPVKAFTCTFATTGWFDADVLWLAPKPAEPFRLLTAAVWAAFPDYPPYGGAFDGSIPHLTVAERALGRPGALDEAERSVRPGLPFRQHIDHVLLIAGSPQPRAWRTLRRLGLADA